MKKIYILLISLFLFPISVLAKNNIYKISMDIYLNEDGSANITEVWDVKGDDGTEWYKVLNGLSGVNNFTVSMDGNPLKMKAWDINGSLNDKKGYYGINYTSNGIELCFGKYDYNRHTFTLNYSIDKYIYNTSDSQYLYWTMVGPLKSVNFENFYVKVHSFFDIPKTIDVWGYGYKGYAYVSDTGIIEMSNEENTYMGSSYAVLLVKFPLGTFNSNNTYAGYNTFDDILNIANEGTFEYDYDNYNTSSNSSFFNIISNIVSVIISIIPFILIASIFKKNLNKYGYKDNKKIDLKNIHNFREIPCNKDIYYANALLYLNGLKYKDTNILGAILLKWVKENKVVFKTEKVGLLKKEDSVIDLTLKPTFDNSIESKLFNDMFEASKDGILEKKEFEKWARKNYQEFTKFFERIKDNSVDDLEAKGEIRKRTDKNECKAKNVLSENIYLESEKLYGLYNYLEEFAGLKEKEVIEVKLWDEYLMFAYLFGIADRVAKQLKNMYPEVLQELNYNPDTFIYINSFSTGAVQAASAARSAAQSYSSGGGGFSSGGGGGGSFGGGGGGSR